MQLRDYQTGRRLPRPWRAGSSSDVLGVAATGAGKTVIFIKLLTELLTPGTRGLILAHREELIDQPLERLRAVAVSG